MKNLILSQKGSALIGIIAVIIVAAILGGGFLAWNYYNEQEQEAKQETQASIQTEEQIQAQIDETANWETYRNKHPRGEYEIKYPSDWKMKEYKGVYEASWTSPRLFETPLVEIRIKTGHIVRDSFVSIDYTKCDWSETQKEWFKKFPDSKVYPAPIEKEQIGETRFCKLKDLGGDESGQIGGTIIKYAVVRDEWRHEHSLTVLYNTSGGYYPSEQDYSYELGVFKQMLSTLKFID